MSVSLTEAFAAAVAAEIKLLKNGKPLEAFDAFYADAVQMYANDALFASGAKEGRAKQEPFINSASSIVGRVTDINMNADEQICVFRNRSKFKDANDVSREIDGLCWQRWADGRIVEERYYDGPMMRRLVEDGVLDNPAALLADLRANNTV